MTSLVAIDLELLATVQGGEETNCTVWQIPRGTDPAAAAALHMACIKTKTNGTGFGFGQPPVGTTRPS